MWIHFQIPRATGPYPWSIAIGAVMACALVCRGNDIMLTYNPGTTCPNMWELSVGVIPADFQDSTAREAPTVNLNCGIGERIKLGVTLPFLIVDNPGEGAKGGI